MRAQQKIRLLWWVYFPLNGNGILPTKALGVKGTHNNNNNNTHELIRQCYFHNFPTTPQYQQSQHVMSCSTPPPHTHTHVRAPPPHINSMGDLLESGGDPVCEAVRRPAALLLVCRGPAAVLARPVAAAGPAKREAATPSVLLIGRRAAAATAGKRGICDRRCWLTWVLLRAFNRNKKRRKKKLINIYPQPEEASTLEMAE